MSTSIANSHAALSSAAGTRRRSDRVKLRRGLTFVAMTLVLPGSAQIAAGNPRLGRVALRIWGAVWAGVLLVALLALGWRSAAVSLLTFGPALRVVQAVLIGVGIGWAVLLVDSWRIARPPELARGHRLGFAILNAALVFLVAGGLFASASMISSQRDLMAAVFAGGGDTSSKNGRFNVLLMGGDAGKNRSGLRPDSIMIASIDADTGRTVLFSLPRNMEDVPFPDYSPLHRKFPKGFSCPDGSCMLNAVYTYATQNAALYPGVRNPGAQATKEAVEGATGLEINYWTLIDLKGFRTLVDAVGGITVDINKRVPIGGGSTKISGYIEAGKDVKLDGRHALWFARSRSDSSDYERMARQKCVMSAMLNQLDPVTVLTKFNEIAAASKEIVATDIPTSTIDSLMQLALKAKELPISSVSFVPPLVYPGSPEFGRIHATVRAKIDAAEAADRGEKPAKPVRKAEPSDQTTAAPDPTGTSSSKQPPVNGSTSTTEPTGAASRTPKPGQDTEDLAEVCSAR